ncbi:MAG: prolyl oligopeptidase family serine peptidase [Acidobacteria bacterium]|nr:prolyl oligopeptidase family serine peptidase [Acidobacteriota bacterium]
MKESTKKIKLGHSNKRKAWIFTAIILFLLFNNALTLYGDEEKYLAKPDTIITEQMPAIPMKWLQKIGPYMQIGENSFVDWDPRGEGMIISAQAGNTRQLFFLEKPGGNKKQLTNFNDPVTFARFNPNPDKKYFIYSRDEQGKENYQYYKYDLSTGESTLLTDGKGNNRFLRFNRQGTLIAFGNSNRTGKMHDVYVMNPEVPGQMKMVFKSKDQSFYYPSGFSIDGKSLIVTEQYELNKTRTYIVDLKDYSVNLLNHKNSDGKSLYLYHTNADNSFYYGGSYMNRDFLSLIKYNAKTGEVIALSKENWDVEKFTFSNDLSKAAYVVNENGFASLYILDLKTEQRTRVESIPVGIIENPSINSINGNIAFSLSGPRMSKDVFEYDIMSGKTVRWTTGETNGLDISRFSEPELIEYPTFDKVDGKPRHIPALYYKPNTASNKPFPVMIQIHGGPENQFRPEFQPNISFIVNGMGIAVIAPNVRGSSGYGKEYANLDNREKRWDAVKDIGALLEWIKTRPELDSNRICLIGGSYGGFMVLASMCEYSDSVTCGVDFFGISSFNTFMRSLPEDKLNSSREEYGDERFLEAFFKKISPLANAHKINKPLFVIQGKNDPRVPSSESEQILKTVRKNGVSAWYLLATNEGHGFEKMDNVIYMGGAIIEFLEQHLLSDR